MSQQPTFRPGWRFSIIDGFVLVVGTVAALGIGAFVGWIGFVIAFTIVHFFLFCNVFRISRPLELAWSAAFIALASATILLERPGWVVTAAICMVLTVVMIMIEMRKPSYHGIGWRTINPGLETWWALQFPAGGDVIISAEKIRFP